jgi:pimeloyl-ACP methyl ester carboxylesterase
MEPVIRNEELTAYGHRVCFRAGGEGPVVVLIHGITGSSAHWEPVMPVLAERYTVIAPDLLGHGESAKPRGDYSLGAYATGIRDLLIALEHPTATVVGHSLGGGVAMQFAYQFPERCDRLALLASGGLGAEVHLLLRAAALPGSELVLPVLASRRMRAAAAWTAALLDKLHLHPGHDLAELAAGIGSLADSEARQAFLHTLRAVIDPTGQRVSATDRLHLAEVMPSLILWGERDPIIPVAHAHAAHAAMPGSRLELFAASGHFPHLDDTVRFVATLRDFLATTAPARLDPETLRSRILEGAPLAA